MQKITLELNTEEQSALQQLIHAALLHSGAGALDVAAHFAAKLRAAQTGAANKPALVDSAKE